jgi:four helix bundle protein
MPQGEGFHPSSARISSCTARFHQRSPKQPREVIAMAENILADLSTEFAVKILNLTDSIKGHHSLSNQLERSGTSIGANIREAKYAHSKADFISKLQISLKECYETEYWIEIAQKAHIISEEQAKGILHDCGVIRRMLIASINTAKANA